MSVSKKNRIKNQNKLKVRNKKSQTVTLFATPYETLAPINPNEFFTAFTFAIQASMGQVTLKNDRSKVRFNLEHEDGSVERMQFGNAPYMLMMAAIEEKYEHDTAMFFNAGSRFHALMKVVFTPEMSPWVTKGKTAFGIPDAVVKAAAMVKLQPNGEFNIDDLIAVLPSPK